MLALGLQTLLLMSAAYCLGAALACLVRRSFFASAARAPRVVVPHVEPLPDADPGLVGVRRFVRAGLEVEAGPSPQAVAAATPRPATPAQVNDAAAQDLKRISAIDAATETALNKLGIRRYDAIAGWSRGDLDRVALALGIRRQRINRENWIEQAQMLATGVETHFAQRRARGETASATPSADQGERRRPPAQPPPAAPPPAVSTRRAAPSMPPATIAPPGRSAPPGAASLADLAGSIPAPPRVGAAGLPARTGPAVIGARIHQPSCSFAHSVGDIIGKARTVPRAGRNQALRAGAGGGRPDRPGRPGSAPTPSAGHRRQFAAHPRHRCADGTAPRRGRRQPLRADRDLVGGRGGALRSRPCSRWTHRA